ncbi:MAG TPA: hypothetical protein PLQ36_02420, partial [Candidatus Gracilibacteria bacterium]|nr:hypothetical protein [Candidatus Gracilibacteria bacterium]
LNQIFAGQEYSGFASTGENASILTDFQKVEGESLRVDFSVCQIFTVPEQKTACEDSLILSKAIPAKNIEFCAQIKKAEIRDECELKIVQEDVVRASEQARQKCMSLTSEKTQQKCLKTAGFFYQDVKREEASDCLDYADQQERINCLRDLK